MQPASREHPLHESRGLLSIPCRATLSEAARQTGRSELKLPAGTPPIAKREPDQTQDRPRPLKSYNPFLVLFIPNAYSL